MIKVDFLKPRNVRLSEDVDWKVSEQTNVLWKIRMAISMLS